jgi:hypothetical protein
LSYRGHRDHQMQSGRTSDAIRRNQAQSGAIRRNQTQSACPEHCVSVFLCFGRAARACVLCFCVLSRHNGPVFCVFVFWQTPLKTQGGVNFVRPWGGVTASPDDVARKVLAARAARALAIQVCGHRPRGHHQIVSSHSFHSRCLLARPRREH